MVEERLMWIEDKQVVISGWESVSCKKANEILNCKHGLYHHGLSILHEARNFQTNFLQMRDLWFSREIAVEKINKEKEKAKFHD